MGKIPLNLKKQIIFTVITISLCFHPALSLFVSGSMFAKCSNVILEQIFGITNGFFCSCKCMWFACTMHKNRIRLQYSLSTMMLWIQLREFKSDWCRLCTDSKLSWKPNIKSTCSFFTFNNNKKKAKRFLRVSDTAQTSLFYYSTWHSDRTE